jgi:hypothetical protein
MAGPRLPGCRQRWYRALAAAAAAAEAEGIDFPPLPDDEEYGYENHVADGLWLSGRGAFTGGARRAGRKWNAAMLPLPVWTWAWRAGSQGDR